MNRDSSAPVRRPAPEVRWLTSDERDAWMALASMLVALPGAVEAPLRREADLSLYGYFILSGLSQVPGRTLRMSDLASYTGGSLSRLSHLVKRLEQQGWIRREPSPDDSRYTNAVLTDSGMDKVIEAAPGHVETVRSLVFDVLTAAQVRQLRDIGRRINQRIDSRDRAKEEKPSDRAETLP